MGFSVSGATALLLIAFLISFGAFYTASTGAVDQVQDAQVDQTDRSIETLNTEIEIVSDETSYNETGDWELTVVARNTGASTLQVDDLSLLVDGKYISFDSDDVGLSEPEGDSLWIPQQRLEITIDIETTDELNDEDFDDRVTIKLVTEHGIAATDRVE